MALADSFTVRFLIFPLSLFICFSTAYAQLELQAAPTRDVAETQEDNLGKVPQGLGLNPGDAVADFTIKTFEGESKSFSDLLEDAPLLVIFYRGGWCPYCNFQIRELTTGYDAFKARGVMPVLISSDKPGGADEIQKTYEIPFPVLSDPDLVALTEFNVKLEIDDDRYQLMKSKGVDVEVWSDRTHHVIAVSSAFIIDQAGTVKWAHLSEDFKVRPSNEQLLDVINRLQQSGEI